MNLGLTIEAKQTNKVRSKHFETASTYFRAHHVWKLKNLIASNNIKFRNVSMRHPQSDRRLRM